MIVVWYIILPVIVFVIIALICFYQSIRDWFCYDLKNGFYAHLGFLALLTAAAIEGCSSEIYKWEHPINTYKGTILKKHYRVYGRSSESYIIVRVEGEIRQIPVKNFFTIESMKPGDIVTLKGYDLNHLIEIP